MSKNQKDELDLIEIILKIWMGRKTVVIFTFLSILISSFYYFNNKQIYESKIRYSVNSLPPKENYSDGKVHKIEVENARRNFKKIFYTENVFNEWKQKNSISSINYEDISNITKINDRIFAKEAGSLLVHIDKDIDIKSRNINVVNDLYHYSLHINELLKIKYLNLEKDKLASIQNTLSKFSEQNKSEILINQMLAIKKYISPSNINNDVFLFSYPTVPKDLNRINPTHFFSLSVLAGLIFGSVAALLYQYIKRQLRFRKIK